MIRIQPTHMIRIQSTTHLMYLLYLYPIHHPLDVPIFDDNHKLQLLIDHKPLNND
jgi:hypothetical protein